MPRALYQKTRWEGHANPNPGVLNDAGFSQSPRQVTDYVLCFDCEQLLDRRGEKYVMSVVKRRGSFPLLAVLSAAKPTKQDSVFSWYDVKSTPMIIHDALSYFAASVFWRAAAHDWSKPKHPIPPISLDPYQEAIRKYLIGEEPFPNEVLLMTIVCSDALSQNIFFLPNTSGKNGDLVTHMFQARGLCYMLTMGKSLTAVHRSLCTIGGTDRWILSRSCADKVLLAAKNLGGEGVIRQLFS